MAFAPLVRHRAVPAAALIAGLALYPRNMLHADSPGAIAHPYQRKPIYDTARHEELPSSQEVHKSTTTIKAPAPSVTSSPGPTDRLAKQIKHTRLFLHGYAATAEDGVNRLMTRFLHLESSFTHTVASLAPSKESGEKLLPGGIYVLVAAMAGSIFTRNRNILLRATVPLATGVVAGYAVLPVTTRNVGNLIWKYEERYPVVRDNHIRIREGVKHFVETGKAHSQMGLARAEEKVQGVTEAVQDWVKKGR